MRNIMRKGNVIGDRRKNLKSISTSYIFLSLRFNVSSHCLSDYTSFSPLSSCVISRNFQTARELFGQEDFHILLLLNMHVTEKLIQQYEDRQRERPLFYYTKEDDVLKNYN